MIPYYVDGIHWVITNVSWAITTTLEVLKISITSCKSYQVVKATFILGVRLASSNESFELVVVIRQLTLVRVANGVSIVLPKMLLLAFNAFLSRVEPGS